MNGTNTDLSLENCERLAAKLRAEKPHLVPVLLTPNRTGLAPIDALNRKKGVEELRALGLIEKDSNQWTRLGRRVQGFL